jgi:hypothetical protein
LNRRPLAPKASALPDCATPRNVLVMLKVRYSLATALRPELLQILIPPLFLRRFLPVAICTTHFTLVDFNIQRLHRKRAADESRNLAVLGAFHMIEFQTGRITFSTIHTRMTLEIIIQGLAQLLDLLLPALRGFITIIRRLALILEPGDFSEALFAIGVAPLFAALFPRKLNKRFLFATTSASLCLHVSVLIVPC